MFMNISSQKGHKFTLHLLSIKMIMFSQCLLRRHALNVHRDAEVQRGRTYS